MEPYFYNVDLNWTSDKKGELSSPELPTKIEVATPPNFPNGIEGIWSPEHLLTAAVSSCYMTTFLAIAENSKLEFKSFRCSAKGKLDNVEGQLMITTVTLQPTIVLKKEEDKEKTERILQKLENTCLITNSIKSTVTVLPTIQF